MTSTSSTPVLVVMGAGPGLGLSIAHRFGAEGHAVALVSRSDTRHADYLKSLRAAGVEAAAFTADAADPVALRQAVAAVTARFGRIDVGYYGPASMDGLPGSIADLDAAGAEAALRTVVPAVDFGSLLLPEVRKHGGGLLFAGGLSSVVPMPVLGGMALASAAVRNYAVTLNAELGPAGVYVGTLTIGGLIERGDIHRAMLANPAAFGGVVPTTLDPDDLADLAWRLYTERDAAEAVINPFATT